METTINQRIATFLDHFRISQEDFRVAMRVKSRQQISAWLTSKENIPDKYILRTIEMYDQINHRWLLTGEGHMLATEKECCEEVKENRLNEFSEPYKHQVELIQQAMEVSAKYIKLLERENEEFRKRQQSGEE